MGGGGYGSGCGQRQWVVFCSGFRWAVAVGWVSEGVAMGFGGGCGRWWLVAVGWVFQWLSVGFAVGFGEQW